MKLHHRVALTGLGDRAPRPTPRATRASMIDTGRKVKSASPGGLKSFPLWETGACARTTWTPIKLHYRASQPAWPCQLM